MCRRQFGSTRACYTPIKEREGVLPQGGLVHLPWPQKGLTFTPRCWHDLQTRSLSCLGGYWNCLAETCSETNRQTGRNHIFYIRNDLSYPVKLEDLAFIGRYGKEWLFFTHLAKCDCDFPKDFVGFIDIGTWNTMHLFSIKLSQLTNTEKKWIIQIQIKSSIIYWWETNILLAVILICKSRDRFSSDPLVFAGSVICLLWDLILNSF